MLMSDPGRDMSAYRRSWLNLSSPEVVSIEVDSKLWCERAFNYLLTNTPVSVSEKKDRGALT